MFEVGDLVRVKESVATDEFTTNREWVSEHGWLWIINRANADGDSFYCTSLATGSPDFYWYDHELEKANV